MSNFNKLCDSFNNAVAQNQYINFTENGFCNDEKQSLAVIFQSAMEELNKPEVQDKEALNKLKANTTHLFKRYEEKDNLSIISWIFRRLFFFVANEVDHNYLKFQIAIDAKLRHLEPQNAEFLNNLKNSVSEFSKKQPSESEKLAVPYCNIQFKFGSYEKVVNKLNGNWENQFCNLLFNSGFQESIDPYHTVDLKQKIMDAYNLKSIDSGINEKLVFEAFLNYFEDRRDISSLKQLNRQEMLLLLKLDNFLFSGEETSLRLICINQLGLEENGVYTVHVKWPSSKFNEAFQDMNDSWMQANLKTIVINFDYYHKLDLLHEICSAIYHTELEVSVKQNQFSIQTRTDFEKAYPNLTFKWN